MSQTIPTTDSDRVRTAHEAARAFEDRGELEPITNCDNCGRAFFTWAHDDDTPLVYAEAAGRVFCETCAHDGTVEGAVCSDHPDIQLSDGCWKCDPDDYVTIGDRHVNVAAIPLNLYAAANGADIRFDDEGEAFLQTVHDTLLDAMNAVEDPAAAWQGIIEDPGYGPDHDALCDHTANVAHDAVSRLQTYRDIILSWNGVNGWAWEQDVLDDGLIEPTAKAIERMTPTLVRIAETFLWSTYSELRKLAA